MTLLTYKIKHERDFSHELALAMKIAKYAMEHDYPTSKDVKHFGLKSAISNQILKKYGHQKNCKTIKSVKLTIPGQSIVEKNVNLFKITPLKLFFELKTNKTILKINQAEIDEQYIYLTVTVEDIPMIDPMGYIGIDLNTTKHVLVAANPDTGKIWKLGKECQHIRNQYKHIRKNLQKKGKYKNIKEIGKREQNKIKNINNQISRKIVDVAVINECGIKMEHLTGIRKQKNKGKTFNHSLNSWAFYDLKRMIEYKAYLLGIPVVDIDPYNTSKECSKCGHIGERKGKSFKCPDCGHVDHADVNAAFVIASRPMMLSQSHIERDVCEGNTDIPDVATPGSEATSNLQSSSENDEPHEL